MTDRPGIQSLYANIAPRYEQHVVPVFGLLANDLARWIARCIADWQRGTLYDPFDLDEQPVQSPPGLTALDVGTGTGILARALSPYMNRVIGADLSPAMLRVAAAQDRVGRYMVADLHHLPLRRGAVQLIASSFGLNASTPKQSLRSLAQVLERSGILAFQEWAVEDDCTRIVNETLKAYAPEDIPGVDDALAAYCAGPKPWYDHLQYAEDYYELLKAVGFDLVWVKEARFVTVHLPSLDTFLMHKLVWPLRRLTVEALSPAARAAFDTAIRDQLAPFVNSDGTFDWSPPLFRVFAVR
ncbi:MAG: methyltransferase domain-containing protein [Anaerolineae bacterium]|nr:methyltransferase domain-containing protein [Anaerolineae bacterium]